MPSSDSTGVPGARYLRWVAFAAAAALTASGEFELAGLAGWPPWVAWLLPVALDVYAFASFTTRRRTDTLSALSLMIACNSCYHLANTRLVPMGWPLVVVVAALPPIICWRVHRLGEQPPETRQPEASAEHPAPDKSVPPSVPVPQVPMERKHRAPSNGRNRKEASGARRKYRPAEETRRLAAELRAAHPNWTKRQIAAQLKITDRQLRNVLTAPR